jgi:oxygen-dependent protoporphyrinogen oxidase
MRIAVVGGGPAGLTAAHRLGQAGHDVTVLEAAALAGGRTHTEHFGPGHWSDDGAGWLGTFYPDTLALLEELGIRDTLRVLHLRGGGSLLLDGQVHPTPNSVRRILSTGLLTPVEKVRFMAWMAGLFATQRGGLRIDMGQDSVPASEALRHAGRAAAERVVRPSFEGPFFSRLEELSGALVRSWLRALSVGTFFQVDGGMDSPWRTLAKQLDVRTGTRVERLSNLPSGGVEVATTTGTERYDAAVVAVPAPIAAVIVADEALTAPLRHVEYAPHVRVYAARPGAGPERSGIHAFPNDVVATVEIGDGSGGAWGRAPAGWTWGLVCAPAASSAALLDLPDDALCDRLWTAGSAIDPRLFPLADAEVVHLVRWRHAVPKVGPGYFRRIGELRQRPPIVFAGDWLVQPCVEGAVRSGQAAAAAFDTTGSRRRGG